ncbi:hypothetical protein [Methanobacterium ferruginis]|uniref:hypothetical protein n=1 Tax=Methanobacterium ferruginis TaxID=710191 RepID=UPI002573B9C3|nr:hypothetical protein [Methanobacterium ferruginis]
MIMQLLGSRIAKYYNVTVGDTFTDNNQQYQVIGIIILLNVIQIFLNHRKNIDY